MRGHRQNEVFHLFSSHCANPGNPDLSTADHVFSTGGPGLLRFARNDELFPRRVFLLADTMP
jgi:hypothetical protein